MKQPLSLLFATTCILLFGAGCIPTRSPSVSAPPFALTPPVPEPTDTLAEAPAIIPSAEPLEDDSTWSTQTMRSGVTLTYPTKGPNAPTWTHELLANDDPHLKGNCYVTDETVYKRTDFPGYENACQTTTALDPGPGQRIDYFVLKRHSTNDQGEEMVSNYLFTFIKTYPAGFDMNSYSLILEKIINTID